jgi:drug/metabolite transporter (DMT)-like permease
MKTISAVKEQQLAGQGAIFLCAVLWSTSGLFIKLVDWHPMLIAGGRSFLAALFLFTLRRFSRKRQTGKINGITIIFSGVWYAFAMIFFVVANKMTASANAILLQYTAPVWTCLLGWIFLGEKPHWEHWGALALVSLGMFLVFQSGLAGGSVLGDALALLSGIAFAANSVVLRMQKDGNPADVMTCSHVITAAAAVPFLFLSPPSLRAGNILSVLFMGIIQIGLASALFVYGIRRVTAVHAMLTAAIEPVLNPVWVLAVTGERPAFSVIAGGLLIVAAVIFSSSVSALRRRN